MVLGSYARKNCRSCNQCEKGVDPASQKKNTRADQQVAYYDYWMNVLAWNYDITIQYNETTAISQLYEN